MSVDNNIDNVDGRERGPLSSFDPVRMARLETEWVLGGSFNSESSMKFQVLGLMHQFGLSDGLATRAVQELKSAGDDHSSDQSKRHLMEYYAALSSGSGLGFDVSIAVDIDSRLHGQVLSQGVKGSVDGMCELFGHIYGMPEVDLVDAMEARVDAFYHLEAATREGTSEDEVWLHSLEFSRGLVDYYGRLKEALAG